MNDNELERWLTFYRSCCEQSGIEPLARRFHDLLAPGFERQFTLH